MRRACRLFSVLVIASVVGCGGGEAPSPPETSTSSPERDPAVVVADSSQPSPVSSLVPGEVVAKFYEALGQGDNTGIASLLTDRAREETAKSGLGIQSQASSSLAYAIGETDYVTQDGAHVKSLWTEADASGQLVSTEVIWVLRKQQVGWRISGMASPVIEGELPLLFNFEDPEDMLQKKQYVEMQLAETVEPLADEVARDTELQMAEVTQVTADQAVSEPIVTQAAPVVSYPQVAAPTSPIAPSPPLR